MGWICSKEMKIDRKGVYVDVRPGEPVPEAESWSNVRAWERTGYVRYVPDGANPYKGKSVAVTVAAPKQEPKTAREAPKAKPKAEPEKKVLPKLGTRELRKKSKDELVELANEHGIAGTEDLKRYAIIELIQEAQG